MERLHWEKVPRGKNKKAKKPHIKYIKNKSQRWWERRNRSGSNNSRDNRNPWKRGNNEEEIFKEIMKMSFPEWKRRRKNMEEKASDWKGQRLPKRRDKEKPHIKCLIRKCESIKSKEEIVNTPREKGQTLH